MTKFDPLIERLRSYKMEQANVVATGIPSERKYESICDDAADAIEELLGVLEQVMFWQSSVTIPASVRRRAEDIIGL